MCGILGFFGNSDSDDVVEQRQKFITLSKRLRHRGPDWSGIWLDNSSKSVICHERLSIVGVDSGSQPIHNEKLGIVLSVNGEIYNYKDLYSGLLYDKYVPQTKSDCEVIIYLYKEFGAECVKMLDGIFGFVLYDYKNDTVLVARDPIGIIPLYYGITTKKEIYFSSELKSIHDQCDLVKVFPPSQYFHSSKKIITDSLISEKFSKYFQFDSSNMNSLNMNDICTKGSLGYPDININNDFSKLLSNIRNTLTKSVSKRLMADVPYGVLLSGGLDSSLICSITSKLRKENGKNEEWGNKLHTFSIGLKDAPDLKYAKIVADFLGTTHHEYNFTVQEGIDAIPDLIYYLETYDVTTIRASTPMFLMSRLIKSLGIKMVLSGEGADEILGGYLYFHNAPTDDSFHQECHNRVSALHHFDCLRANKSTMSWGLEARVPFLDRNLLQVLMPIHPSLKLNKNRKIEKYVLRQAFSKESSGEEYLPDEILWRQKEQFSDGVGYNWIDKLKEFIESEISDDEFQCETTSMTRQGVKDIPITKEALYFRRIFDEKFPDRESIVPRWIPRTDWEGVSYDPSGRAQKVHENSNV